MDNIRRLQLIDGFESEFVNSQKAGKSKLKIHFPIEEGKKPHSIAMEYHSSRMLPEEMLEKSIVVLQDYLEKYSNKVEYTRQSSLDEFH